LDIVTFRDLEKATIDAITLFGNAKTKNIILEKSYKEYMEGFKDTLTGELKRGYKDVVKELKEKFSNPAEIVLERDKKEFVKLFGEYLKLKNILQNYDEFVALKELEKIDKNSKEELEKFKELHHLSDEDLEILVSVEPLPERLEQDYSSTYNDIREKVRREKEAKKEEKSEVDWDDVVFEVDLLKSQEINLDYILELIFEKNKKTKDKDELIKDIRTIIKASIGHRAKESLMVDFISSVDLDKFEDKAEIIDGFFKFAQIKQKEEAKKLIESEKLNEAEAKRYIEISLKKEYASENGTELNSILPKMSPLNPNYLPIKQRVFQKIAEFVEKFKGVGGLI